MLWNYQNKHKTYCRCKGIDGKEYIVRQDALISGATHTIHGACSGGIQYDVTGQRFGRLVVVEPTSNRSSNGGVIWKCKCDCGNYTYATSNNLKRGHTTSCGCAKTDFIESTKLDVIGKKYGHLTVLEEVFPEGRKRRMIKCLCDCGNIIICDIASVTTGHTSSCGCDKRSKGEALIKELLDKSNIKYIPQHRFSDCKNKKRLRFDFYLPDLNTCIEYDGYQHFHPVEYWGGEKKFLETQQNDKIKNEYCKKKGIKLVRILYKTKKEEIYKIISDLTSPASITA